MCQSITKRTELQTPGIYGSTYEEGGISTNLYTTIEIRVKPIDI